MSLGAPRAAAFLLAAAALHLPLWLALAPQRFGFVPPRLGPAPVSVRLIAAPAPVVSPASVSASAAPDIPRHAMLARAADAAAAPAVARPRDAAQPDAWLPSGRLTRLPAPLDAIELDPADMRASGLDGRIELTVFVDRDGRVARVVHRETQAGAREFAERVARRFEAARFSPGEIDGVPVNALVKIAVVSESQPGDALAARDSSIGAMATPGPLPHAVPEM